MARMTYADAARLGLAEEMRRDRDASGRSARISAAAASFGQYKGLQERVRPRPHRRHADLGGDIMGAAVGAARVRHAARRRAALLPISRLCAADEIVNQAAKARYMFGGQARVPLVVRQPIGICAPARPRSTRSRPRRW